MKNTQRGITLIALVITIIVMLILVGVTISMAVNGGLFEKAGEAAAKTNNAVLAEQALSNGAIEVGGGKFNSIDEYLTDLELKKEETPEIKGVWVFNENFFSTFEGTVYFSVNFTCRAIQYSSMNVLDRSVVGGPHAVDFTNEGNNQLVATNHSKEENGGWFVSWLPGLTIEVLDEFDGSDTHIKLEQFLKANATKQN